MMAGNVQGVVLAGGSSSRLGEDKALLTLGNRTLLQISVDNLFPLLGPVLVIGREPVDGLAGKAVFYPDLPQKRKSALGGLYSALSRVSAGYGLVVAVDMPFLQPRLLQAMVASLQPGDDILIPREGNYLQPLCALYSVRCLSYIREALVAGEYSIRSFFPRVRVNYLPVADLKAFDPDLISFFNINTPEDYIRAQKIAAGKGLL